MNASTTIASTATSPASLLMASSSMFNVTNITSPTTMMMTTQAAMLNITTWANLTSSDNDDVELHSHLNSSAHVNGSDSGSSSTDGNGRGVWCYQTWLNRAPICLSMGHVITLGLMLLAAAILCFIICGLIQMGKSMAVMSNGTSNYTARRKLGTKKGGGDGRRRRRHRQNDGRRVHISGSNAREQAELQLRELALEYEQSKANKAQQAQTQQLQQQQPQKPNPHQPQQQSSEMAPKLKQNQASLSDMDSFDKLLPQNDGTVPSQSESTISDDLAQMIAATKKMEEMSSTSTVSSSNSPAPQATVRSALGETGTSQPSASSEAIPTRPQKKAQKQQKVKALPTSNLQQLQQQNFDSPLSSSVVTRYTSQ